MGLYSDDWFPLFFFFNLGSSTLVKCLYLKVLLIMSVPRLIFYCTRWFCILLTEGIILFFFFSFQITKLQAAVKYGEEDLPAAKVCKNMKEKQK